VIPVLNEEKSIGECIEWIKSLDPSPYEIIVVDGGSEDDTVEVAKKSMTTCRLWRVNEGERSK
jgi:glycosyltransferase involved in cell wall biosynthesis